MIEDFNPLDLSAPQKITEEPIPKPQAEFRAKPTVNRISMGPLFHSRITKIIALILGTVLSGLLGYVATAYLLT
ncbi:hypothetical protein KDA11_01310 [Candidatus Saccharibacteria bacterium]|nr:hypothetical protein [Candidatus Saccharibacteria bacterium]